MQKRPDVVARTAEPKDKVYKINFGNGLYLWVSPKGKKSWRGRYRWDAKERNHTFGHYPDLGVTAAREEWQEIRTEIRNGVDPSIKLNVTPVGETFEDIANDWLRYLRPSWRSATYRRNESCLRLYVLPELGSLKATEITTPMVVRLARRIEQKTSETAHRALNIIAKIYQHAAHEGLVTVNPGELAKGCLRPVRGGHFPAILNVDELGRFLYDVSRYRGAIGTETCLRITQHLFQRPSDVRFMRWQDIDWEGQLWTFKVRKNGQRHQVPLSDYVVGELRRLWGAVGDLGLVYCFPSMRDMSKPFTDVVIGKAFREMGYQGRHTPHGCRATARTLLAQELKFPVYLIERTLAHSVATLDRLNGAYDRTDYLGERRKMMQAWSDFLQELEQKSRIQIEGQNV